MKKSKKGVTLVELIICCFIIVMVGGACTALLMSGEHIYSSSANAAGAQLDSDVLQTYMMKMVPSTEQISQISLADAKAVSDGTSMYFDDENEQEFTICIDGDYTTIGSVSEFKYTIVKAGAAGSLTARAQFTYKVTMNDDSEFTGGFMLSNMKFDEITLSDVDDEGYADLKTNPFYLSDVAAAS